MTEAGRAAGDAAALGVQLQNGADTTHAAQLALHDEQTRNDVRVRAICDVLSACWLTNISAQY